MKKKVSVIVTCYNTIDYFEECLQSVVSQTYDNLQIIIVDDGSNDGSGKLADEYATKRENIRVIHQPNQGLAIARNSGLYIAEGEYITFVDADDLLYEDSIEKLMKVVEESEYDIVVGAYDRVRNGKNVASCPHGLSEKSLENPIDFRFKGFYATGHLSYDWGKLYRLGFIKAHGLYSTYYPYTQDKARNMRCQLYNPRYGFTDASVYRYRVNLASVSYKYHEDIFDVWNAIGQEFLDCCMAAKCDLSEYESMLALNYYYCLYFAVKQELDSGKGVKDAIEKIKEFEQYKIAVEYVSKLANKNTLSQISARDYAFIVRMSAKLFKHKLYRLFVFYLKMIYVHSKRGV